MSHKHAQNIIDYGKDALRHDRPWEVWQYKMSPKAKWVVCQGHPMWRHDVQYRRTPREITVNGRAVPAPMDVHPVMGMTYYYPNITGRHLASDTTWDGDGFDQRTLDRGLVHEHRADAITHARAILNMETPAHDV